MINKTKKTLIVAGALTSALLVGGTAVAGAGGKNCGEGGSHYSKWSAEQDGKRSEKRMDRLASKLELNDEQKAQVQSIFADNHAQMQQQRETNREALKAELSQVLTAEQMETLEKLKDGRHGKGRKANHGDKSKDMTTDATS